jgi:hypothetical protein
MQGGSRQNSRETYPQTISLEQTVTDRQDLRKNRDRSNDKGRARLFNELAVGKLRLSKDETEATYRDRKQAGLLLRINKSGAKSWRVQFYDKYQRKMRSKGLGEFKPGSPDHISVKDARNEAALQRALLETSLKKEAGANKASFRSVAELYLAEHVEGKRITADRIKTTINKIYDIEPTWRTRPFESITRPDVVDLLKAIAKTRGDRAADITLVALRRMMTKHAIGSKTGYLPVIVPGMQQIESPKERARERILTDQEIRVMFALSDGLGTFGNLCKMCLYTAQRRGKVAEMRFDDIEDGIWIVPKENREKGTGARLKLPPPALAIVEAQRKLRTCGYVFPSSAKTPFSAFGQAKHELDVARGALEGIEVPGLRTKEYKEFKSKPFYKKWHWIIHDLRRTSRSLMGRIEIPSYVAERVLGHAIGGVEEVYDRHNYDRQRAEALLKLSVAIGEILQPPAKTGNVVSINRR